MTRVGDRISQASDETVVGAVRNIRLTFEAEAERIDDGEVRSVLGSLELQGRSQELRDEILTEENNLGRMAWIARGLLLLIATDPDAEQLVVTALDDAEEATTMDFGLSALLILGAVALLWRWRPKSVKQSREGFEIIWPEDDGSQAADVAKVLGAMTGVIPPVGR